MGDVLRGIVEPASLAVALWLAHRALRWLERRGYLYYLGDGR